MNSICFDTETTGLHPNSSDPDEILTISIIERDGSVLLDERFRPTVKTEWPHASAINGIYPEDVADLPTIETAIPRLRKSLQGQMRLSATTSDSTSGSYPPSGCARGGRTHYGHHEPVHVVHGKALQVGGCRRPHRIRVDGQGTRFACRRARDACRAAMARTMARSRVDTCLGRVKRCFSHALIFAAQVCAIYVVILLSGLLVFWSAIFIDSRG